MSLLLITIKNIIGRQNAKDLDQLKTKKIEDTKYHCASVLRQSDELVTKALDEATSFAEFKAAKPANYTTVSRSNARCQQHTGGRNQRMHHG